MIAGRPLWLEKLDRWHLLTPLRIVLIMLVAVAVTFIVRRAVDRMLRRTLEMHPGDRMRAEARQRALATVVRSSIVGVIWAAAVITIVGEVGVNVGGVIATATVVGGAVAFGAQTLVRDLIAGFFVLAEDQYGVGDAVDLGLATGTVDRITLRSVRLRDGEGRLWYVPHGNVARVANSSKASVVPLDAAVDRSAAVADVRAVMDDLAGRLVGDPALADALRGEPHAAGVFDLGDDRVVYRTTVGIAPGRAADVRRVWRELLLEAFRDGRLSAPAAAAPRPSPQATE